MNKLAKLMLKEPIKSEVKQSDNELHLYGTVGDSWDGFTLTDVKDLAEDIKSNHIKLRINSYGGDAVEGVAIRNYLRDKFDSIEVVIDGIAASAASIIALSGESIHMPSGSTFMIHNPHVFAFGNKHDLQKTIASLESIEASYKDIYMEHFNGSAEALAELMDDEAWLTASEAKQYGFATSVDDDSQPEVENVAAYSKPLHEQLVAQASEERIGNDKVEEVIKEEVVEQPKIKNQKLKNIFKALSEKEK